ncbi:hypothetical protein Tco_0861181 [Tanacetum coccineum]|uniref:Uncharacterized protein n=1 Tax=Tanacetum coccineum TaxID=301880 RepID=A0ABQ5BMQ9_9ASTR
MLLNLDQLEKQLDKEEFQEIGSFKAFRVLMTQFQTFVNSRFSFDNDDGLMIRKYFIAHTRTDVQQFCVTLIQRMESVKKSIEKRAQHKREYDSRVNERQMLSKKERLIQISDSYLTKSQWLRKEIEALETINIELEHSVAKLLAENEKLHKENEHLKQTYKDLYDSIKKTRFAKPSILRKPVLQPPRNQSVVRQPNAFKYERPNFSKPWFASQVDVNNVLSKPVTPHYLPKVRKYVLSKPHHVIAPGLSRNSSKESYGSNDMAHNYYLEKAKKKRQDKNMNLKPSVMHTTSLQNTANGSKPKPRSNNQTSRSLPVSKSSCGMSNDYISEDQYAVSIKEDTAYPCLHSPKTTKGMKINTPYPEDSIRRIQDMESI